MADVVRNVGFTANSFAILTVENPDSLGLKGYQRELVRCTVSVMGYDGTCSEVSVERFLTQLGFGDPVTQLMLGSEVNLRTSMVRMQLRCPERLGWPAVQ